MIVSSNMKNQVKQRTEMRFIKLNNKLLKRHEQLMAAGCVFPWISEPDYDSIDFDDTCSTTTKFILYNRIPLVQGRRLYHELRDSGR